MAGFKHVTSEGKNDIIRCESATINQLNYEVYTKNIYSHKNEAVSDHFFLRYIHIFLASSITSGYRCGWGSVAGCKAGRWAMEYGMRLALKQTAGHCDTEV